jgi:hypothetical protein
MKNMFKVCGILIAMMIIGLLIVGCGGGAGSGNPGNNPPPEKSFFVEGTYGSTGKFQLSDAASSGSRAISRAISSESYAVSGILQDGDFSINLTGTYDPIGLKYTASAATTGEGLLPKMLFSIDGSFDENGDSLGSTATVATEKNDGSWQTVSYSVNETAAVTIDKPLTEEAAEGGIPSSLRGYWNMTDGEFRATVLLSPWTLSEEIGSPTDEDYQKITASLIEITGSGSNYNTIFGFPYYEASKTNALNAAQQFATENYVTATRLEEDPYPPMPELPDGPYYYFELHDESVGGGLALYGGDYRIPNKHEEIYNAIMGKLDTLETITDTTVDNAIKQVLSSYGINNAERIPAPDWGTPPTLPNGAFYYYYEEYKNIQWGWGGPDPSPAEIKRLTDAENKWWDSNYLERYLIKEGVQPTTRYQNLDVRLSGNNRMTIQLRTSGSGNNKEWDFATLNEARNANGRDAEDVIILTR